jgi:hypothetical protein
VRQQSGRRDARAAEVEAAELRRRRQRPSEVGVAKGGQGEEVEGIQVGQRGEEGLGAGGGLEVGGGSGGGE